MKRTIFLIMLSIVLAVQVGWGQIPQTISYQGVLTDANGKLVPDGTFSLTFGLHHVATGGTPLWSETQSVSINNGIFNVILGSATPLTLPFDEPYWLGVTIGSGPELTPRIQLTSSAYSLNAQSIVDNAVTSSKIANSAVTSVKIADSAVTSAKVTDSSLTDIDISNAAAIAISKISGDAGIEFADLGSSLAIPTTVRNLGSISVNCPTSGFVLLFLSGTSIFFGENTELQIGLGTTASTFDLNSARAGTLDGNGTLRTEHSVNAMAVTIVTPGVKTFFANALKPSVFSANQINLADLYLVAVFFPKRY